MINAPIADCLLSIITLLACAIILWRVEPAISHMSGDTHWMIRYAMLLIAGGALGMSLILLTGWPPTLSTALLVSGIALLLLCERRVRFLVNHKPGVPHA